MLCVSNFNFGLITDQSGHPLIASAGRAEPIDRVAQNPDQVTAAFLSVDAL